MRNIKNQSSLFLILALASWVLAFGLPASSANQQQDPVVTSRQIAALPTSAATSEDRVALYQALLDLQNPWTVMCVAAHPDDEDGTSLIVMRHKYGAHTVSLFSTFGEGGQNAIGPELYEELGAIRARETMAAAEIQGSEPYFLGLKDFGFSKTRDEAFRFWGHEEALRRMVLQIRKLRPDVIITNHSTTSNDHGQHQATALMVVEAFDAAADATKFPEQLKDGVTTWQVQRLFVRTRGNQQQAVNTQIITIDPNEKDPVRGVVYAEEALRGLQQHATQGPWPKTFAEYANRFRAFSGQNAATGQLPMIRYTLVKSATGTTALPNDSHNFLDGMRASGEVAKQLDALKLDGRSLNDFANEPERIFDHLIKLASQSMPNAIEVTEKERLAQLRTRLSDALAAASGLQITLSSDVATPKSDHVVSINMHNSATRTIALVDLNGGESPRLDPGDTSTIRRHFQIPGDWTVNLPLSEHLYKGYSSGLIVRERIKVTVANRPSFLVSRAIELDVAPPVEIGGISPLPLVIHDEVGVSSAGVDIIPARFPRISVQLINHLDQPFKGVIVYGRDIDKEQTSKVELLAHQNTTIALSIPNAEKTTAAHARGSASSETFSIAVRAVGSRVNVSERRVPIVHANAHVARNLNVGYIRGFDFSLPNALNALGVESKELSVDEVKTGDLSQFTSVIDDNRVYESKPELIAVNQKLLDYANAGGNLIVFYHKSDEWNPDERRNRPQLAPFKLILGGERITDENAPISFLEPDHPLLNTPNKMGQDDFKDWIQERGLYYPKEWDPQFHALLQSNDPGEQPLKGGLLVADYGKGHYIYTSMVWYRELRGGIPGAYRMLANMISYGAQAK